MRHHVNQCSLFCFSSLKHVNVFQSPNECSKIEWNSKCF
uniref:Uncharacterized protein n=1 Tax=Anguilla anguilla TaxID=7936 RepID=A0A0E9WQS2_ANGAN